MNCYDVPQYWDLAFGEDTEMEADFVVQAVQKYCDFQPGTVYEPGCGGGRLVVELASRGIDVIATDTSQASIDYAQQQLANRELTAKLYCADMTEFQIPASVDAAYCLVNTFRHLLTEEAAVRHLKSIASGLRQGGLYLLGLHLFPPDADTEDNEEWSVTEGEVTVDMRLDVADCCRDKRLETLQFAMTVTSPEHLDGQTFQSDYRMRLYEAGQMQQLLSQVPELKLVDVFDFWYDLDEPLKLNDELGDTVLVLQKS